MGGKCCKKFWCCCCISGKVGSIPEKGLTWMLNHTQYDEREIRQLHLGFQLDFPLGGINRKDFEQCFITKNAKKMSDIVFRYKKLFHPLKKRKVIFIRGDDPKERAEKLFSACDVNNDGFLTEEEFLKGCRNDTEMMKLLDKLYNYLTEGMDE